MSINCELEPGFECCPGPEFIKLVSCSTQLSTKFQLLIKAKIPKSEEVSCFKSLICGFVCLFDLILYAPSTIFQLNRDGSSWVEPILS